MKKFLTTGLISAALLSPLTFVGGCNSMNAPSSMSEEDFNAFLKQDELAVQRASSIAVRIYALTISNDNERAKIAGYVYQVSDAVEKAMAIDTTTLEQVRALAMSLINSDSLNNKDRQVAGLILDSVVLVIEQNLDARFGEVKSDRRSVAGRALVKAAAKGIKDATYLYRPAPTTKPATLQQLLNEPNQVQPSMR